MPPQCQLCAGLLAHCMREKARCQNTSLLARAWRAQANRRRRLYIFLHSHCPSLPIAGSYSGRRLFRGHSVLTLLQYLPSPPPPARRQTSNTTPTDQKLALLTATPRGHHHRRVRAAWGRRPYRPVCRLRCARHGVPGGRQVHREPLPRPYDFTNRATNVSPSLPPPFPPPSRLRLPLPCPSFLGVPATQMKIQAKTNAMHLGTPVGHLATTEQETRSRCMHC